MDYIYVLTHMPTHKKYVGRSGQPETRLMAHMNALIHGYHRNKAMQADYDKYGGDYKFEIVSEEHARNGGMQSDEKKWMCDLKTYDERYGYNCEDPAMVLVRLRNGLPAYKFNGRYKDHKRRWVYPT